MKQNEIKIDPVKLIAVRGDEILDLPLTELRVLALFLANKGKVLSRAVILASMQTDKTGAFSNIVDVYVAYLRKKIGKEMIKTVRGGGYCFQGVTA